MAYRPYIWRKENPEKRTEQKRREKVRAALRQKGILPQSGESMNEEQQIIYNQIGNNDFSYWDTLKRKRELPLDGGKDKQIHIPKKSPEYIIWYRAKDNSQKSNREFNLSVEDITIPEYCPYLNIKLSTQFKDNGLPNYFSIDRIDSSKGYIKENIQVISRLANTIKNNATIEELITFSQNILKLHNPK